MAQNQARNLNPIESRVMEAIDLDGLLSSLCELVAIPSLGGQESPAQHWVASKLEQFGLTVDAWDLDFAQLSQHPAYSYEIERQTGLGVVGQLGESAAGHDLIFNGHVDVVPAGDLSQWRYAPWKGTIADGRVYGRGALDMKGGLCCALYAAKALREAGVQLRGRLLIQSVIGEEDGGLGTLATILRGYRADGAVVMEPTQLIVAPAQAGALNFRITVPGRVAHGSLRTEGVSAIEKFIPIYQALMDLERTRNQRHADPLFVDYPVPHALCVGTVKGGDWASNVPESLTFEGRYGVAIGEDLAAARQELEETLHRTAQADPWLKAHPPQLEWWGGQFEPAAIPADHPLVQTVSAAYGDASNTAARVAGMPYGADMRLLVNLGHTPTVLFGPGDIRHAHRPDEFVPISDLVTVTQTLALTALRFCGYRS